MKQPNNKPNLFAGPWIGEFGWELFCWHGFIRKLAEQHEHTTVMCRTGHEFLYRDFADRILYYDPIAEETDMWKNHAESPFSAREMAGWYSSPEITTQVRFDRFKDRWWLRDDPTALQQKWVQLVPQMSMGSYDILMHIRDTNKCNTAYRNWDLLNATRYAEEMLARGYRIACIGKSDAAAHIDGTADRRNITLEHLAALMCESKLIIGPQSGPIHFATLVGLPQMCWQTCREHAVRTALHWNPFDTSVWTYPAPDVYWKKRQMWQPAWDMLANETERFIEKLERQ